MHRKNSAELTLAPPPAVRPLNAEPDPNVVGFPPPSEYAVAVDLPSPEDERLNEPELRELVIYFRCDKYFQCQPDPTSQARAHTA